MTLVLTEVSPLGVAMAADSALTWSNGRSFSGAQKLIPAVQVNAGFSIWGNFTVGNRYADEWLQAFISRNIRTGDGLWGIAQSLAQELNRSFDHPITEMMGIHVAGYDTKDRVYGPAFYHVHNGHAPGFGFKPSVKYTRLSNFRHRVLTQAPAVGETSIGGPITVLTISEGGIQGFYTR